MLEGIGVCIGVSAKRGQTQNTTVGTAKKGGKLLPKPMVRRVYGCVLVEQIIAEHEEMVPNSMPEVADLPTRPQRGFEVGTAQAWYT